MSLALAFISTVLWRSSRYRQHAARLAALGPDGLALGPLPAPPGFDGHLAIVPDLLAPAMLATLRAEAEALAAPERSYVPAHKKGGTVAYETVIAHAPAILGLYHSRTFQRFVSEIVGCPVGPTPLNDQSSLSVLVYDRPGDHIGWHFDHNFYRGRHFTILLPVVNRGHGPGGLSHARLAARPGGREVELAARENTLIVFEGARVRHKVSPIAAGERRVVISMTYCTDARARWWQAVGRRVKDTAFFGIRALWT